MGKKYLKSNKNTLSGASVISRFISTGQRQGWWNGDGPIVAAVSGGSDSIAMLWLLCSFWKGAIVVAHLEHGFRKETAIRDAKFVEDISRKWGLLCKIEHRDVPSLRRVGESLEEAGRRERYQFLTQIAEETGARLIATGHTADDSAETLFFNIIRGTGIRGLRGIPEVRNDIIRPVIECFRDELQSFLSERMIPWVTDESNEEVKYFRNRIRHVIFPFLEKEANPQIRKHLLSLGADACEIERHRESFAGKMSSWCQVNFPFAQKAWRINILRMLDAHSLQSLFAKTGRDLGLSSLSRVKTASLLNLVRDGVTPWRFQWENNIEICGSRKMAAIIDLFALSNGSAQEMRFSLRGESGTFKWGHWIFFWCRQCGISSWSGDMVSLMPFPVNGSVEVSNIASVVKQSGDLNRIPWWCLKEWPVVSNESAKWSPLEGFLPGSVISRKAGDYIRIRAVFVNGIRKGETPSGL